ncbi:hypothetical protein EDD85DRAFT_910449 [Armillaria nabsnona]|nr:hypothetical protein EDD85DRAFT_910449 [Armillaria nabsnona]
MVYHAYPELTGVECLTRAVTYFFLCIGIKCLIMTIHDILDYDIDANVERTKNRALPRGAISLVELRSPSRDWCLFGLQCSESRRVSILALTSLSYADLALPFSLRISMYVRPLHVLYPTCKHWMYFAPIPLGLMFNIGVYMGWADIAPGGLIPYHALTAAYVGATLWTITYETVYQHQDKVDDVKISMKSLAILCGKHMIPICSATTVGFAGLMSWAGYLNGQGIVYYVSVVLSAFVLMKELVVTDIDKPMQCMRFFLHTPTIGNLILAGFGFRRCCSSGRGRNPSLKCYHIRLYYELNSIYSLAVGCKSSFKCTRRSRSPTGIIEVTFIAVRIPRTANLGSSRV